jgi:hypothetical protein
MPFNPSDHIMKLKNKDYLPVAWRLVWLRDEHPEASIETDLVAHEGQHCIFKARVEIELESGKVASATGYGSESIKDFGDYIEKAETKAIGRALGALGYGTQFTGDEFDEGTRIVDSPQVVRRGPAEQEAHDASAKPTPRPAKKAAVKADAETGEVDMQPYFDSLRDLRQKYKYTNDQLVELIDTLPKAEHFNLGNMTPAQAEWLILVIPETFELPAD